MKLKTVFRCQNCGYGTPKWMGQCPDCGQWNTLVEEVEAAATGKAKQKTLTEFSSEAVKIGEAAELSHERMPTGISELDRLLGGGVIGGQIILLAGAPGIGKSTLMLQIAASLGKTRKVLYVSGEESAAQVGSRAKRLGVKSDGIYLMSETALDKIKDTFDKLSPEVLIIDSVQTIAHPDFTASAGTVGQVRECAAELLRICKPKNTVLFLLGHVTKDGTLAGPKVLEHIVDTVLYFDSEKYNMLRILRAYKNRFGPTSEIGLFSMDENGLSPVDDAGAYLESETKGGPLAGRAFSIAMEGSRPLIAEIQALVAHTRYPFPRRMVTGLDLNRCQILLAALEKHVGINLENKDVFISLAGGIRLNDSATDLAVCAAVISSARDIPLSDGAVFIGEVGILGQTARISSAARRLAEARRLGFTEAFVPQSSKDVKDTVRLRPLHNIQELAAAVSAAK